jgi:APA family basic amino acid/polyamine antiporter
MKTNPDALLVRALGVRQLAAGIFNYTVGSGIFAIPALAVLQLGSAAPLGYLVCAVLIGLVVVCFAEAGSRVSVTGGPYAYVEVALGPYVGFLSGALLWVTELTATAAVATLFAGSVEALLGSHSVVLRWFLICGVFALFSAVNIRGVRTGARVLEALTVAKLVPLVSFVLVGAFFIRPSNLVIEQIPNAATLFGTAGILVFAFAGIEGALVPSGEVRDPARTVPRAILIALVFITLLSAPRSRCWGTSAGRSWPRHAACSRLVGTACFHPYSLESIPSIGPPT